MRFQPIPLATLLLITSISSAAATATLSPQAASALYRQQLAAKCPDKHLEMLSPASLSDLDDTFMPYFSPAQRRVVQTSIHRSCRGIDMGASCGNVGFLQAAIRLHKLDAFTTRVCAQHQRCTGYSTCTDTE